MLPHPNLQAVSIHSVIHVLAQVASSQEAPHETFEQLAPLPQVPLHSVLQAAPLHVFTH